MERNAPKDFVLQLGALGSLYLSVTFLLILLFGVINLSFPTETDSFWNLENYQGSVRLGIAMLIVFFPTYVFLTRLVNQHRREVAEGNYLTLTKWLVYLSLLVGALTLLVDLVIVITTFLEGDITIRFVLKAVAVLVIVGLAVFYYTRDAKGYWLKHEKSSKLVAAAAATVVFAALVFGFMNIETPSEVREQKLDQSQIQDLQQLQWMVRDYYLANDNLPETLDDLSRADQFTAPEGRADYRYEVTDSGFNLCAEFSSSAPQNSRTEFVPTPPNTAKVVIIGSEDWYYEPGDWCFERTIKEQTTE